MPQLLQIVKGFELHIPSVRLSPSVSLANEA